MFYVHDDIIGLMEDDRIKFIPSDASLPFNNEEQIGPGSVDLRLGFSFLRFKEGVNFDLNTADDTDAFDLKHGENLVLKPNEIILANTLESVFLPSDVGAIITGRSSLSRIGLQINISQDFIQPGYANPIPLQLVNLHSDKSITLPCNIRICQIILFNASSKTSKPYLVDAGSKYATETVKPEPSKLGIEYGKNVQSDFTDEDSTSKFHAQKMIDQWRKQLEAENKSSQLKKGKNSELEIGQFVSKFIGSPNIVCSTSKSIFQHDSMFTEVRTIFSDNPKKKKARLIDVCCGYSSWMNHITSIEDYVSKIEFVGVDMNSECIKNVENNQNRDKFLGFECYIRKATDLKGLTSKGTFDIAYFTNSLHEICPSKYHEIFSSMNGVVNEQDGKVIVTDMEKLPDDEIESIAITWTKDEFKKILDAGGFKSDITTHPKSVNIFQAVIKHNKNVNEEKMLNTIKQLLISKRKTSNHFLDHLEANPVETNSYKIQWLKQIGLISRISLAIQRINDLNKSYEKSK